MGDREYASVARAALVDQARVRVLRTPLLTPADVAREKTRGLYYPWLVRSIGPCVVDVRA